MTEQRTVLWVDDDPSQRAFGERALSELKGIRCVLAGSSGDAEATLASTAVDALVTDILRRDSRGAPPADDGYRFVVDYLRPRWPMLPVLYHTKNLPQTFKLDSHSQFLSKWDNEELKAIELERRLADVTSLYEAFADESILARIAPRLVEIQSSIISSLRTPQEVSQLNPSEFEQLVGEVLDRIGYSVLWVPGGNDQGIDIIASHSGVDYLIDVKRYSGVVQVELVRHVWGVAMAAQPGMCAAHESDRQVRGGIITSSRFSRGAEQFRRSVQERPLLRDGAWLQNILGRYVPRR